MTYTNPVGHMGYRRFAAALADAGIDGGDPARPPARRARRRGRRPPTPPAWRPCSSPRRTTPDDRLRAICERSRGFVYGVSLLGVTGERDVAGEPGAGDGAAAARRSPTSRCCSASASPTPSRRWRRRGYADGVVVGSALVAPAARGRRARRCARLRARAARRARRLDPSGRVVRVGVIKYLGSKRRLVPVLAAHLRGRRRRAPRSTSSPAPRAWRRRSSSSGAVVTAVDTARYSEVFAQTLRRHRRHRRRQRRARRRARAPRRRSRASPATSPRRSASGRGSSSRSTARASTRSATAIERDHAGSPLVPDPAHEPDRGRRPGRLHHRRADGLREAVGAALVPAARAARARSSSPAAAARCAATRSTLAATLGDVRSRLPRPAVQPAPLLHQLPRVGDARRVGRARALRRRVQAGRRTRRPTTKSVFNREARHARRAPRGRARRACSGAGAVVQRRVVGRRSTSCATCARCAAPSRCSASTRSGTWARRSGSTTRSGERVGTVSHVRNREYVRDRR